MKVLVRDGEGKRGLSWQAVGIVVGAIVGLFTIADRLGVATPDKILAQLKAQEVRIYATETHLRTLPDPEKLAQLRYEVARMVTELDKINLAVLSERIEQLNRRLDRMEQQRGGGG